MSVLASRCAVGGITQFNWKGVTKSEADSGDGIYDPEGWSGQVPTGRGSPVRLDLSRALDVKCLLGQNSIPPAPRRVPAHGCDLDAGRRLAILPLLLFAAF